MSSQRIGILGGAFDPVHIGHLILAREAQDALGLDRVILMPGAQTPLKGRPPSASDEDRLAMLTESVRHLADWEVCDWEIRQGGVSYSLHTAAYLRTRFPEATLFWIIGADQLSRLSAWHKLSELGRLVRFAVAVRNGDKLVFPPDLPVTVLVETLPARRVDISSTEIRERLRDGRPGAEFFLTEPALRHIRTKGLYRD
jgi:nicotinate-nucleotide adenylyltransferase